ncbi:MAG: glutamine--tRNA ligase/YqeY domain fusion protein [Acidobacteriota bacterium]
MSHEPKSDFIRDIVRDDLAAERHTEVVTRFPPEPNGYLHIGHAKSIGLNFGLAREHAPDARCHLRFDDTNPTTEDVEYTEAIQRDVRWLGYDWGENLFHASDYFPQLYAWAEQLIRDGLAYVDHLDEEAIREYRGTVTEPGRPSPFRDRSVEENLQLFRRMRDGEFQDGECVLRAKIDLAATNMKMRDPLLYRIRHSHHYRTGDDWVIYPMYDWAHCLSDAIEGITHSLCTLEFENNRELYDWIVERVDIPFHQPRQIEFARGNVSYAVTSKRKLLRLVEEGHVAGWDDPRMPTIAGMRRRGVTPEAIRAFWDRAGIARTYNVIDYASLEHAVRDDLNTRAPRVLAVLDPIKVVLENYPEGETETFDAPYWPHDIPKEGERPLPFGRELYIERDDFAAEPPPGFFRLVPGGEVRLRYAYVITCHDVVRDDAGEIVELRCTYDPDTRGGNTERKVKGTIHWVAAHTAVDVEVRLYDRLFAHEDPAGAAEAEDKDFVDFLNPQSLEIREHAKVEPSLAAAQPGDPFQFERQGYFVVDETSTGDHLVFNRTVTLRDTWAKVSQSAEVVEREASAQKRAEEKARYKEEQRRAAAEASTEPELSAEDQERASRFHDELGVAAHDAAVLAVQDEEVRAFFSAAIVGRKDRAAAIAAWMINELLRELKDRDLDSLPVTPDTLAALVGLVEDKTITATVGKEIFAEMVEKGGDPVAIVDDRGLEQLGDADALLPVIETIITANPAQTEQYRGGKTALMGFFIGQVMRETGGRADAKLVRELLVKALG